MCAVIRKEFGDLDLDGLRMTLKNVIFFNKIHHKTFILDEKNLKLFHIC